ncbi:Nicotinamide-nucleotide amidase [hydrothermal vent metagenome]|uniref:Nicotinamide-nucleotide amidase n=1 Tax=hydrothermal vent metagenome TaxID=652676 RepID=A0A3B0SN00_9ZZZZ
MFSAEIIKLATETLRMARDKGLHLATAESCTGGLIMAALTGIAGSSDVVDRGFITYTNRAKMEVLGVSAKTLRIGGAVTRETAIAMAEGALEHSSASVAVSVTGIAGPGGGSAAKPVGLVHMAIARRDGETVHEKHLFGEIGRDKVREATVIAALGLFQKMMI